MSPSYCRLAGTPASFLTEIFATTRDITASTSACTAGNMMMNGRAAQYASFSRHAQEMPYLISASPRSMLPHISARQIVDIESATYRTRRPAALLADMLLHSTGEALMLNTATSCCWRSWPTFSFLYAAAAPSSLRHRAMLRLFERAHCTISEGCHRPRQSCAQRLVIGTILVGLGPLYISQICLVT